MPSRKTLARIGAMIKARRRERGLGLRAAATECAVSPSTLSRLERGGATSLPDADTLTKLASWLGTTVSALLSEKDDALSPKQPALSTPEVVEVHLRADKRLSPKTADALARMFQILYDQFAQKQDEQNGKV